MYVTADVIGYAKNPTFISEHSLVFIRPLHLFSLSRTNLPW